MSVPFSNKLVAELFQPFWRRCRPGSSWQQRSRGPIGTEVWPGCGEASGVPRRGRDLRRYLSFGEQEEIALGLARGESMRSLASRLGRNVSTISGRSPVTVTGRAATG
jgi:transposase, IS30 family